jgi:hypothetical protein
MDHNGRSTIWHFTIVLCLLGVPHAAESEDITVNSICEGTCPSVPLSNGQSTSGTFNFNYTFGDGDTYNISGSYGASYSTADGSTIAVTPVFTYIGTNPSVGADTLNFDLFQDYFDTTPGSWAGTYYESGQLILTAPGTASAQLLYDAVSVGLVTQNGPGIKDFSNSANLDFGADDTADTLSADYDFVFDFSAGTTTGEGGSAPSIAAIPEPAMMVPCGLCLVLVACCMRRRGTFLGVGYHRYLAGSIVREKS